MGNMTKGLEWFFGPYNVRLAQSVAVMGWIGWIEFMNTWWRGELFAFLLLFSLPSSSPPSTSSMPEHINSKGYIFMYIWIRYECITQRNQNHIIGTNSSSLITDGTSNCYLIMYHLFCSSAITRCSGLRDPMCFFSGGLTMGRCNHTCDRQLD